jgi:hypothetical protein
VLDTVLSCSGWQTGTSPIHYGTTVTSPCSHSSSRPDKGETRWIPSDLWPERWQRTVSSTRYSMFTICQLSYTSIEYCCYHFIFNSGSCTLIDRISPNILENNRVKTFYLFLFSIFTYVIQDKYLTLNSTCLKMTIKSWG